MKKEFTEFGWSLQVAILRRGALQMGLPAILRRGALQMGLPPARLQKDKENYFLEKEFTKFGWSLQATILRRGALQIGLPPARLEKG